MEHNAVANGNTLEVSMKGKFTFADNKSFSGVLEEIANENFKNVVINMESVEFIDSAALGILLLARDKCEKAAASLVLKHPVGQVKQMFDISRFSDLFNIEHKN